MSQLGQALLETPLGATLNAAEADALAQAAKDRRVARGEHLFKAGDKGDKLYFVLEGAFDVVLGQPPYNNTTVAKIGPGQIVGELEVMTRSLRVASLIATEPSRLLELDQGQLEGMLAQNSSAATKVVTNVAKTLARRLAAVNQRILEKTGSAANAGPTPATSAPPAAPSSAPRAVSAPPPSQQTPQLADADLDVLDKLWA